MAAGERSVREVVLNELMGDADKLLDRLETIDSRLAATIEESVRDAAGKAFLSVRMNFESVINENERKLIDAGRVAAATMGNQLNAGASQLIAVNGALESKARRFVALLAVFALSAGLVGGYIGAKLALM